MKRQFLTLWVLLGVVAATSAFSAVAVVVEQQHQNDALSAVICHAEHLIRTSKGLTGDQRRQALHFYRRQIRLEHLKTCS